MPCSVLIADSYPLMAASGEAVFSGLPDVFITGVCFDYKQLAALLKVSATPDVIILDALLRQSDSVELCKNIRGLSPQSKIILFGTEEDPVVIKKCFQQGIHGYLLRKATPAELLLAVTTVQSGGIFFDDSLRKSLSDYALGMTPKKRYNIQLTRREREILQLIVEEHTTKEIANTLYIELCTVETHRQNIMQKLGAKNTAGLVRVAIQQQLYKVAMP